MRQLTEEDASHYFTSKEQNLDLVNIKKVSTEKNKSQIDAVFELKLTDESKILDVLVKEQSLDTIDLSKQCPHHRQSVAELSCYLEPAARQDLGPLRQVLQE